MKLWPCVGLCSNKQIHNSRATSGHWSGLCRDPTSVLCRSCRNGLLRDRDERLPRNFIQKGRKNSDWDKKEQFLACKKGEKLNLHQFFLISLSTSYISTRSLYVLHERLKSLGVFIVSMSIDFVVVLEVTTPSRGPSIVRWSGSGHKWF